MPGLSIQARDGAIRDELEVVIIRAMAGWNTITSDQLPTAAYPPAVDIATG